MIERQIDKPIPMPPAFVVKKGSKTCSAIAGSSPGPGVFYRDEHAGRRFATCFDPEEARPIGDEAHGFHRVHDQIEHNLLQLNLVAHYGRRWFSQLCSDHNLASA